MRLSKYFLPTLKEEPREVTIRSHSLMIRAGLIRQVCSGMYTWLPAGLRVLRKLEALLREVMDSYGFIELLMPCIQPASLWRESLRYEVYGKEMLKMQDRHNQDLIFGPTAEELITDLFRSNVTSYNCLPKVFYQFQWKFRDEIRPRFGLLRAREFFLKDAYSFSLDQSSALDCYWSVYRSYLEFFKKVGVSVIPTEAVSGAIGGDLSHEFHILTPVGESDLQFDPRVQEVLKADAKDIDLKLLSSFYAASDEKRRQSVSSQVSESRGIEVGHTFYFGTKYSEVMKANVQGQSSDLICPHMGSYGIGLSRLVGAIVEASNDQKGIIWPKSIAPFQVGLINLCASDSRCNEFTESTYRALNQGGIDVLYDDTSRSGGQKLVEQDLLGLPLQIRVGDNLTSQGSVEIVQRAAGKCDFIPASNLLQCIIDQIMAPPTP